MLSSREITEASRLTENLGGNVYDPFNEASQPRNYSSEENPTSIKLRKPYFQLVMNKSSGEFELVPRN